MELEVLEKDEEKLLLEMKGEDHTFLNILREKGWETEAKQVSYMIEHPYLAEPKIFVHGKNPLKILKDSAQLVIDEMEEFSKEFKRALKK